jgi:hypothetical protein
MLRDLQSFGVNVDATKKASATMKRGSFVNKNEANKTFGLASAVTEVYIVDRDCVVTKGVAMGEPYSDYDSEQDTINSGEFAGLIALQKGVRKATSEYNSAFVDSDVTAGKYLTVGITGSTQGQLIASPSNAATSIKSLGWVMDNGHKLLGFEIV